MCDKIISDRDCNTIVQNENYSESYVYVYILQLNRTDETLSQTLIRESAEQQIKFTIGQDGFYTLCKLRIPKDETQPYYSKDGKFYKGSTEIELQELVDTNPNVTQVDVTYYYYFQLCKLRACYVALAQQVLDERAGTRCENTGVKDASIYKRDLVWSAINTILYMAEIEQFEEAERLLERILGCNGLCDKEYSNCGCQ